MSWFPSETIEKLKDIDFKKFDKIKLPMLRCSFPKLIAEELVSIQPMKVDYDQLYYYDKKTKSIQKIIEEEFFKKEEFEI